MELEWDEADNSACFERRGFDFACAARAFLDPHRIVARDRRRAHGVVYTPWGSAVRVISARKANPKEVADHEHDTHQD